jgi:pilus assembly protein CpaB
MKLSKTMIIFAIILAVITTGAIYFYIQQIKGEYATTNYIDVWVAKENIPPETEIEKEMIQLASMPESNVLDNALRESSSPVGLYSKESVIQGEQILSDRVSKSEQIKFSYKIPKDMRAITLNVGEVAGVDHLVEPGDFVDVVVFFSQREEIVSEDEDSDSDPYPDITKIILQNIEVLSIGQAQNNGEEENPQGNRNITFALSNSDAEKLVYGDEIGSIRLALRNPEDDKITDTKGSIYTDLVPDRRK